MLISREERKMAASHVEILLDSRSTKTNTVVLNSGHREKNQIQQDERLFPNSGGAFTYRNQTKLTRNRHIIWYEVIVASLLSYLM